MTLNPYKSPSHLDSDQQSGSRKTLRVAYVFGWFLTVAVATAFVYCHAVGLVATDPSGEFAPKRWRGWPLMYDEISPRTFINLILDAVFSLVVLGSLVIVFSRSRDISPRKLPELYALAILAVCLLLTPQWIQEWYLSGLGHHPILLRSLVLIGLASVCVACALLLGYLKQFIVMNARP